MSLAHDQDHGIELGFLRVVPEQGLQPENVPGPQRTESELPLRGPGGPRSIPARQTTTSGILQVLSNVA